MNQLELESSDGVVLEAVEHRPAGQSLGVVIMAHDLGTDMDEGGMFFRLAERLSERGLTAIRFSFRGNGGSGGWQRDATFHGQTLDLAAVVDAAAEGHPCGMAVVVSGFAAVPLAMSLPSLESRLRGLVLWQPVLDLTESVTEPRLRWGRDNFGSDVIARIGCDGYAVVAGEFEVGAEMLAEMRRLHPYSAVLASRVPTFIVHGDMDELGSHQTARALAMARPACEFQSIPGAGHGFQTRDQEDEVLDSTVNWLVRRA